MIRLSSDTRSRMTGMAFLTSLREEFRS